MVKFFNPAGSGTWYGVEFCPEQGLFFGYVEGLCPGGDEWGYFSLAELSSLRLPFGFKIERDLYWKPKPMGEVLPKPERELTPEEAVFNEG